LFSNPFHANLQYSTLHLLQIFFDDFPDELWTSDLLNEYEKKKVSELHCNKLGCQSVILLCRKSPSILTIDKPSAMSDWKPLDTTQTILDENMEDTQKQTGLETVIIGDDALPGESLVRIFMK